MITCKLLSGICTIIVVTTLVKSGDDLGSDEEVSIGETDKFFAKAAPKIEPSIIKKTAIDSFSTAQLFDLWTLNKKFRSLISETVELFFKSNTKESDIKHTESELKPSSPSTDEISEDLRMQLINSTPGRYKYLSSKSLENRDTKTNPTIDQKSTRGSPSIPVTSYQSKDVNGTTSEPSSNFMTKSNSSLIAHSAQNTIDNKIESSSTAGNTTPRVSVTNSTSPDLSTVVQSNSSKRRVNNSTVQVTRSTVKGTASISSDSAITPLFITRLTSNPKTTTIAHVAQDTAVNETVPSSTTDSTSTLISKTNPKTKFNPNGQGTRTGSFSYGLRSTVNGTASNSTLDHTITQHFTNRLTPNPSPSTTANSTQNTTTIVNRSASSSTTRSTITPLSTKHFTSNPSPSTTGHATQYRTISRTDTSSTTRLTITPQFTKHSTSNLSSSTTITGTVSNSTITPLSTKHSISRAPSSTTGSTVTPISKTKNTTTPTPSVESTLTDSFSSGPIITLLSRTHLSTPSLFTMVTRPTDVNRTEVRPGSTTANTITKSFTCKSDQVTKPKTVHRAGPSFAKKSITTPLLITHRQTKVTSKGSLSGSKDSHSTTMDTPGSGNSRKKKREGTECNIHACYGKEECEQEVEAYKECISVKPIVNQTSSVQIHIFMFMIQLLCSLVHIY